MAQGSWVGLDVHARSVLAGVVGPDCDSIVEWLCGLPAPVRVAYEAGPTGYALARACRAAQIDCLVAAPSRIARAPGDRVKTDRRDTERLVRLLRLGELTAVRVPDEQEEAARDLVRAREDARGDLMRARHRLSKLLLRHGRLYPASAWTKAHADWLARQHFDQPVLALAFEETHAAMLGVRARRDGLDAVALASEPRWAAQVGRLCCLRGVSVHTALALCTEIGDWERFSGASIGAFLGLVPSESSSAQKRQPGPITKTGNAHARRLLVEAAWHHRRPMRASAELARRRQGQSAAARDRAERAGGRPHKPLGRARRPTRQALDGGRRGRRAGACRLVLEPRRHGVAPGG